MNFGAIYVMLYAINHFLGICPIISGICPIISGICPISRLGRAYLLVWTILTAGLTFFF
jgi:hypothetical protein